MSAPPNKPAPWANRLNKLLDQFHAVHGGDRFPVDVEALIQEVPALSRPGSRSPFRARRWTRVRGGAVQPECRCAGQGQLGHHLQPGDQFTGANPVHAGTRVGALPSASPSADVFQLQRGGHHSVGQRRAKD